MSPPEPPGGQPPVTLLARLLRHALETMQLGVTITNAEGRILYTNPAEARMHGFTVDELLGQEAGSLGGSGERRHMSVEDMNQVRTWAREGWNRRKDGSVFPVRLLSDVVRDEEGTPIGMVTTCEDISDRRHAEDTFRETAVSYRALVENAPQGICRIGADGRFTLVNRVLVQMLEYPSASALLAADLEREVYGAPDQAAYLRERAVVGGRIDPTEITWHRKDGTPLLVRVSGRILETSTGHQEGFELFVEDVTERRILEDQLRHAQKMETVGQLTGGVAHDFNNLLTVIQSNVDYILSATADDWPEVRRAAEEMQHSAHRGSAMVRQLMAFSRHEGLQPRTVELGGLTLSYRDVLRRLLPETIEVQVAAEQGLPAAHVDPRTVEQILLNLATNARDAMPAGGTLRVQVMRATIDHEFRGSHGWGDPGEYVAIVVSDTGIGMTEAIRRRVFEPFFTTKPPGIGTGLGLAMVYGLMKQQRGFVHVYSEPGQGTAFKLWFPVGVGQAETEALPVEEAAEGGSETILLVEDEAPIRRAAQRLLEKRGYTVLLAEDGQHGLSVYLEQPEAIDLVVTDLVMPRMGGRELFERIRAVGGDVPFLFASGYTRTDAEAADALGAETVFIQKPWSIGDLLRRVREALARARA